VNLFPFDILNLSHWNLFVICDLQNLKAQGDLTKALDEWLKIVLA
jgi:hypothetical protein